MPKTSFSDDELSQLVAAIIMEGGRSKVEELLTHCHEYVSPLDPTNQWAQPYEKYFHKQIVFQDFDLHIPHLLCDGEDVVAADIQFKRPSRFPAPLLNRNRPLLTKLRKLLRQRYPRSEIEVK